MNNKYVLIEYSQEKLLKEAILSLRPEDTHNPYYDIHLAQSRGDVTDALYYREDELLIIVKAIFENHRSAVSRDSYFYEPVIHALSEAGIKLQGQSLVYPDDLVLTKDLSEA